MKQFYLKLWYCDGKYFEGDDVLDSVYPGWVCAHDGIEKMAFHLGDVRRDIVLSNYEAYNFFVEESLSFNGKRSSISVYILGRLGDMVDSVVIDMLSRQIVRTHSALGKEYNGTATLGWKEGRAIL